MRRITRDRIRRAAVGITVAGSVGSLATATSVLAAKPAPHGAAASCTVSASGVGSPMSITGTGYQTGSSYRVEIVWPSGAGVGDTAAWADASGAIAVWTIAYWTGTYQVAVYSTTGNGAQVASCSTTVG